MERMKNWAPTNVVPQVIMPKTYQELKSLNKEGNLIFLSGNIQLVFMPSEKDLEKHDWGHGKMHTVSIEGKYYVHNIYDLYEGNELRYIDPYFQEKAIMRSGCGLMYYLKSIAINGELMDKSGRRLRLKDVNVRKNLRSWKKTN